MKIVLLCYLLAHVVMSLITFGVFALDKLAAAKGRWRTPEATLHLLSLLCGVTGAVVAIRFLRHKSSKPSFLAVTICIAVLHALIMIAAAFLLLRTR